MSCEGPAPEEKLSSLDQGANQIVEIEGAVTEIVLRAIAAQERARALAQQSSRLRAQFQRLSRRQEAFEASI